MFSQMIKNIKYLVLFLVLGIGLYACSSPSNVKKIGIIVPLENKALDDIVAGFTETLQNQSAVPIKFKIANAQGDLNLQRAIIQQMKNENYDVIVPIGTGATQMSNAIIQRQPIVALAANFYEQDRKQLKSCHITAVHDEISPNQIINFIHQTYPNIKKITLIHSSSDKIFLDVKKAVAAGDEVGIQIKPIMVPTLNELYSVANNMPKDSQAILILKDIMIASGINTLKLAADKRNLPLIASDQGSVQEGAMFALGVYEKNIGVEGAKLTLSVLSAKPVCDLPMVDMTNLTVFVNKKSFAKANQSLDAIKNVSEREHYQIEFVNHERK